MMYYVHDDGVFFGHNAKRQYEWYNDITALICLRYDENGSLKKGNIIFSFVIGSWGLQT